MEKINKKRLTIVAIIISLVLVFSLFVFISKSQASFFEDILKFIPQFITEKNNAGNTEEPATTEKKVNFLGLPIGENLKPENKFDLSAESYESAVTGAVESASPSVVSITISKDLPVYERCKTNNPFSNLPPEFQQFFGDQNLEFTTPCQTGTKKQEVGGGTGFIVSTDGLVVTNKHVVSDTKASYVVLTNDGKKYEAKVLDRSPVQDIALIKIEAVGLPVIKLGSSDNLKLGQTAIAIGNALAEYRNTVSVGVVSGLARNITASDGAGSTESISGVIQTDAAINPGNSGGPLLNLRGEVVGINVAVASGAQSIGFAIPINLVKKDIESVKKNGKIVTPYLGVRYVLITKELAEREKLKVESGALLRGGSDGPAIVPGSPAEKAGLLAEDIVLEVGGKRVGEDNQLSALIQAYNTEETVNFKILRKDKELIVPVTLVKRPDGQ